MSYRLQSELYIKLIMKKKVFNSVSINYAINYYYTLLIDKVYFEVPEIFKDSKEVFYFNKIKDGSESDIRIALVILENKEKMLISNLRRRIWNLKVRHKYSLDYYKGFFDE